MMFHLCPLMLQFRAVRYFGPTKTTFGDLALGQFPRLWGPKAHNVLMSRPIRSCTELLNMLRAHEVELRAYGVETLTLFGSTVATRAWVLQMWIWRCARRRDFRPAALITLAAWKHCERA